MVITPTIAHIVNHNDNSASAAYSEIVGIQFAERGKEALNMNVTPQDYFAELYVAGLMANAGWNVYFPHRDRGMDFIVSKTGADGNEIIRPVQVKGKYPLADKSDKTAYGYVGKLNQLHPDMVLAIPFFAAEQPGPALFVAYMPRSRIKTHSRGYRCQPAAFKNGEAVCRREYKQFFDKTGLELIEQPDWK